MTAAATPSTTLPDRIRARIHNKALSRIPRMFDAGCDTILAELLQNARRSGTDRVFVTYRQDTDYPEYGVISIEDNGFGIAQPEIILLYGANAWQDAVTEREDAAGMGFASLASHTSTVSSRIDGGAGWETTLEPAHFQGDKDAPILSSDSAPRPHGTRVDVRLLISYGSLRLTLQHATRHYPLPVTLENLDDFRIKTETMKREDFLKDCVHTKHIGGVTIGAAPSSYPVRTHSALNFHGHTLDAELPTLQTLDGRYWYAYVDVHETTDLNLVLPQRRDVVKNNAFRTLQEQVKTVLYETVNRDSSAILPFSQYLEAQDCDSIPSEPKPALFPWNPDLAYRECPCNRDLTNNIPDNAFIIDLPYGNAATPMEQTLDRAFRLAGERDLAFNHDTRLQGYTFYNDLPRLVQVEATATLGGKTIPLPSLDPDNDDGLMLPQQYEPGFVRPDALSLVLTFKTPRTTYQRTINTDLVMAGPMPEYTQPSDNWLLTKKSKLSTNEIARYLTASYLQHDSSCSDDAWSAQVQLFTDEALHYAISVLDGTVAADLKQAENILKRHLPWLFNSHETYTLTTTANGLEMTRTPVKPQAAE